MIRLENWRVVGLDPYAPPEMAKISLSGKAYGHPNFEDGHGITTSDVVAVDGRMVTTCSGSQYELGEIDPKYREWLEEHGREHDEENPIKTITMS